MLKIKEIYIRKENANINFKKTFYNLNRKS